MFQEPLFLPESNWHPPVEYPNLSRVQELGIDLETKDPNLKEKGPGSLRGDGYPVGIGVATHDRKWYFPFAHQGGGNLSKEITVRFVKDLVARTDLTLVFANALYDIEWLDFLGITVRSKIRDVQIAAALLDEERFSYELDPLALDYLGLQKDEELLEKAALAYGHKNPKDILWKLHSKFVGPYAENDPYITLALHHKLVPLLQAERLTEVYDLECRLLPYLWKIRKKGMQFNEKKAVVLNEQWLKEEMELYKELHKEAGWSVDIESSPQLARLCLQRGITPPKTEPTKTYPKGQYSVTNDFLQRQEDELLVRVKELRQHHRLRKVFVEDFSNEFVINGRVHCSFKPTRDDDGGTRTGRFSARKPNLTQIPGRHPKAKHIRALFDGGITSLDFSSQEPRLIVHFASVLNCPGAEKLVRAYHEDPDMDFYVSLAELAGISRTQSKTLTLAVMYDMGIKALAEALGTDYETAEQIYDRFHENAPFMGALSKEAKRVVRKRGWIKTLSGRRSHFDFWETVSSSSGDFIKGIDKARAHWPNTRIRRAFVYKALNRLIQGSAADFTKKALLDICENGIIPVNIVHDEILLDTLDPKEVALVREIMEQAYPLRIPMRTSGHSGEYWVKN
jgi:DNA polymerase-1